MSSATGCLVPPHQQPLPPGRLIFPASSRWPGRRACEGAPSRANSTASRVNTELIGLECNTSLSFSSRRQSGRVRVRSRSERRLRPADTRQARVARVTLRRARGSAPAGHRGQTRQQGRRGVGRLRSKLIGKADRRLARNAGDEGTPRHSLHHRPPRSCLRPSAAMLIRRASRMIEPRGQIRDARMQRKLAGGRTRRVCLDQPAPAAAT